MNGLKPHLLGLPHYPYKKVDATIKLDQNESPHDLPPQIKAVALERLAALDWNRYPDLHADTLRHTLGAYLDWPTQSLVISPGSNLLIQALAQAANTVLDTAPSFPHYAFSARLAATPHRAIPLGEGFALPYQELLAAMDGPAGVLFLPNPHAPTGALFDPHQLENLAKKAQATGWLLVFDEAYHQFSGTNLLPLARQYSQVAVLRTFSKAWGLGGIRAGYLMANPVVTNAVQNLLPPFGLPAHTEVILQTVLEQPDYVAQRAAEAVSERERIYRALQQHASWQVYPSHSNFLLIRTPDAAQVYQQLLAQGLLVRRQDHYAGLEGCIRVSVGTPAQNDRFLQAVLGLEATHA